VNESLSFWSLITNAGWVVQLVMLILFLASMVSWVMIIQRFLYFRRTRQAMTGFEDTFWSGIDLSELYRKQADGEMSGGEMIFRAGFKEYSRLRQQSDADAVMEGLRSPGRRRSSTSILPSLQR